MSESIFDRSILSSEAVKLLDVLLRHASDIGRVQVPSSVLLKESGLTQGALVRARARLTRASLVRTEPGFSTSGLRGANVYVLNMTVIEPPSTPTSEGESGRIEAEEPDAPVHPVSGEVPAPSGRHRSERKGIWKKFFGRTHAS